MLLHVHFHVGMNAKKCMLVYKFSKYLLLKIFGEFCNKVSVAIIGSLNHILLFYIVEKCPAKTTC